jgi:nucleotide-binding universal stress UspA family protein
VASVTTRLCDDTAVSALPLAARYCDLLLIGQRTSPADVFADDGSLARTLLVHAPCPVLVVPADCARVSTPQRPLIAWDGSMEASRAVRAAMPLLKWAQQVTIICFPPQKYSVDGGAAGKSLVSYLACHGIDASIVNAPVVPSVGHALLTHAREHAHDLLVMGSFRHSRFREIMLGGATHTVLTETTVPVLMNH